MLKLGFQNQFMLRVLQSFVLAKTKSQIHIKICNRNSFYQTIQMTLNIGITIVKSFNVFFFFFHSVLYDSITLFALF